MAAMTEDITDDRKKYMDAWADTMLNIWRDKIAKLGVMDTTSLFHKMERAVSFNEDHQMVRHRFLEYGIYQDLGTGRGYKHGNEGDLQILDPVYRVDHGLNRPRSWNGPKSKGHTSGKPRKRKEWYSRAYYASVMVLKEHMSRMYAEEFVGIVVRAIDYNYNVRGTSLRNKLWDGKKKT